MSSSSFAVAGGQPVSVRAQRVNGNNAVLPGLTDLELTANFGNPGSKPILLVNARGSLVLSGSRGLNAGADDYLTKPFAMRTSARECER